MTPTEPNEPAGRRAADVLLRALPATSSLEELEDLCALAAAPYAGRLPADLDAAIARRRRELEVPLPRSEEGR